MDPLSLTVGVAGLVSLTVQLSQIIGKYIAGVKSATNSAVELSTTLTVLNSTLCRLSTFLREENANGSSFEYTSVLFSATGACKAKLQLLCDKLGAADRRIGRAINQLKWPLDEKWTRMAVQDLQAYIQTFGFALTVDGCALLSKTSGEVSDTLKYQLETIRRIDELSNFFPSIKIQGASQESTLSQILQIVSTLSGSSSELSEISCAIQRVEQTLEDQSAIGKREDVLRWLSAFEPQRKHKDVRARRLEGTGQWLLDRKEFRTWRDGPRPSSCILWCHGIPGAGKTVLSSLVIDNLKSIFAKQDVAIAFFYFDYRDRDNQSPANVVASLLKQVASLKPTLPDSVAELHKRFGENRDDPQLLDLQNTLLLTCQEFRQAYVIIDALDECAVGNHRTPFLKTLVDLAKTSAKVFVTSRPHPDDIKRSLGASPQITIEANGSDIRKYLAQKIDQDGDTDLIDEQLKEEIIRNIANGAQGIYNLMVGDRFLLSALQIQTILDQTTRTKVRRALKEMPKDLYGTFEKTLDRIRRQPESRAELGIKTLMWISHVRRPIMVSELRQALAVSLGSTSLDKEDCPLPKRMVECCLGLVIIDEESSTIRLVHFSVQEYFRNQRKELFPLGEQTVAETCLTYLSFDEIGQGYSTSDKDLEARLQQYPFLIYAAHYWGDHGRNSVGEAYEKLALAFLCHDLNLVRSTQVKNIPNYRFDGYSKSFPRGQNALHAVATPGLDVLVRLLLKCGAVDANAKDDFGRTPLSYAAMEGREAVVRLLLDHDGIDVNAKNKYGQTPLSLAAVKGHDAVVQQLLDCDGIDADAKDRDDLTPLSWAAAEGREAVVQLLLDHDGIDVNAKFGGGLTPLSFAAMGGHDAVVRLLLDHDGIDADVKDKDGQTPLSLAAMRGHEVVVRLLLDHGGIDADVKDKDGQTPLSLAAMRGHEVVVRLLLDHGGIDADVKDKDGQTPLSLAAMNGHKTVVQLLSPISDS